MAGSTEPVFFLGLLYQCRQCFHFTPERASPPPAQRTRSWRCCDAMNTCAKSAGCPKRPTRSPAASKTKGRTRNGQPFCSRTPGGSARLHPNRIVQPRTARRDQEPCTEPDDGAQSAVAPLRSNPFLAATATGVIPFSCTSASRRDRGTYASRTGGHRADAGRSAGKKNPASAGFEYG